MPIELIAAIFVILSSRWVYLLAKRFNKPKVPYTAITSLVYLVGGGFLTFIFTFTLLMIYGEFAFDYQKLMAASLTLLGLLAVGIYYLILLRVWKKQQKKTLSNKDVLDDDLKN